VEVFDTYTSIWENAFQVLVGVLCAVTAALLPVNIGDLAGYIFFLIPVGMTMIGSRRRNARRKLEAATG
jgi:hypothetical protein